MFRLDSQLENDTVLVAELPLCLVLLNKDANYPWCILVPKREGVREVHELSQEERLGLSEESCVLAQAMEAIFSPYKMNVAALGNVVSQLHIHHIARYKHDVAWPQPVWGLFDAVPYVQDRMDEIIQSLREELRATGLDINIG